MALLDGDGKADLADARKQVARGVGGGGVGDLVVVVGSCLERRKLPVVGGEVREVGVARTVLNTRPATARGLSSPVGFERRKARSDRAESISVLGDRSRLGGDRLADALHLSEEAGEVGDCGLGPGGCSVGCIVHT